jgi:RHS repeat-associated protein
MECRSIKQFVWSNIDQSEERNSGGVLTRQFFSSGQTISGISYFFTKSILGSIQELMDSSANIQAQYSYDAWGQPAQAIATQDSTFGYAGNYLHKPSGFNLCLFRAYIPSRGRWISRDPIREEGGLNLYRYSMNQPTSYIDPSGLKTYPANAQGYASFAAAAGLSVASLACGCRSVVNSAIGHSLGGYPEDKPGDYMLVGRARFCKGNSMVQQPQKQVLRWQLASGMGTSGLGYPWVQYRIALWTRWIWC